MLSGYESDERRSLGERCDRARWAKKGAKASGSGQNLPTLQVEASFGYRNRANKRETFVRKTRRSCGSNPTPATKNLGTPFGASRFSYHHHYYYGIVYSYFQRFSCFINPKIFAFTLIDFNVIMHLGIITGRENQQVAFHYG